MKKIFVLCTFICCTLGLTAAEDTNSFYGKFNHVGIQLSAGTEGIGFGIAAPLTKYLELSIGVNSMPKITIKGDVDVNYIAAGSIEIPTRSVEIKASTARTTFDFKANCYPFGTHSTLFLAAGFSFGGDKILQLQGHSEDVKNAIEQHPELKNEIFAEIDKYNVHFNNEGNVDGCVKVSSFRPYLGLGFGRLVPKHRVGARIELGCQFHGKM
ncbi:MAG TPA: hypothetical protein VIQ97_03760, partial [Prevotella sp.]